MYIKYKDYKGTLNEDEVLLMSHQEFVDGGDKVKGVPVTVTPNGSEPKEVEDGI